jgi:hypothetical protein
MNIYRKYIIRIASFILPLVLVAGCATTQGPEQALPQTEMRIEQPRVKQQTEPAEVKIQETPQVIGQTEPEPVPLQPQTSHPDKSVVAKAVGPKPGHTGSVPDKIDEIKVESRSGWARLAEFNDKKLVKVYKGLDKATALLIMQSIHNPFKREKITGANGQLYEVYFYLTREPRKGRAVTEKLCTPVIFSKNEVVAIGKFHLKKLRTTGIVERKKRRSS